MRSFLGTDLHPGSGSPATQPALLMKMVQRSRTGMLSSSPTLRAALA